MAHELIAICDECKHAVADSEGSLWVDMAEVDQHAINVPRMEAAGGRTSDRQAADLLLFKPPLVPRTSSLACSSRRL
ncbi:hypothetical protein AB0903_33040 [Streptomyces sp. NPDC048389]|uniref:hypothetical protein n=1 Tax=Streptomyces sp. NPDC048389 TaxID=3154622 RepID=UPI00345523B2